MSIYDGFSCNRRCRRRAYAREESVSGEKDSVSPGCGADERHSLSHACNEGWILDGVRKGRDGAAGTSSMQYARLRMPMSMLRILELGASFGTESKAFSMRCVRMGFVPEVWRPHLRARKRRSTSLRVLGIESAIHNGFMWFGGEVETRSRRER